MPSPFGNNDLLDGYHYKRGDTKKQMAQKAKQWLIDVMNGADAQAKVDKMILEAFEKQNSGLLSKTFSREKEQGVVELIKKITREIVDPNITDKINSEFSALSSTTPKLEKYLTTILGMKGIAWKKRELAEKGKKEVKKFKGEIEKPKVPNPKISQPNFQSLDFDTNLGIPSVDFSVHPLDLGQPNISFYADLSNLDLDFTFVTDYSWSISDYLPKSFTDIELPGYFLKDIFFDFIVDLSLSAPFFSTIKAGNKLLINGKDVISNYKEIIDNELTTAMRSSVSQVHVLLSDCILKEAWSMAHSKAANYATHIADFAASLTPAAGIANIGTSVIRFGLEIKILAGHYIEVKAINGMDNSHKTKSGYYVITKSLLKRHTIIACQLLEKLNMYSMFGLSTNTNDIAAFQAKIASDLAKLDKNLDPLEMHKLIKKVYGIYFDRLKKQSLKVQTALPYSITYK